MSHDGEEKLVTLWPCEVASVMKTCYQDNYGQWKLSSPLEAGQRKPMTVHQFNLLQTHRQIMTGDASPIR